MEDYVKNIGDRSVLAIAMKRANLDAIIEMGGTSTALEVNAWLIAYDNETQLAEILQRLRDIGMPFAGGSAGWPPAEVANLLREKGKMRGVIREIVWTGPDHPIVVEQ